MMALITSCLTPLVAVLQEPGEVWGRDSSFGKGCWYQLPPTGTLELTYLSTPKVPRFEDCIDEEMMVKLMGLMSDKTLTDRGTTLVQLAVRAPHNMDCPPTRWPQSPRDAVQRAS